MKTNLYGITTLGITLLLGNFATAEDVSQPNVLFLAVDDMKDWVGCLNGYEGVVKTPNIDSLAKQGLLFTNAHCPSPKCAPSRAAIMTGLRPSTTGLYDNGHWWYPNFPDVVTIPQCFRNNGYQVVGAGKIFHHTAGNNPPNQWDDFFRLTFRNDPWFRGAKLNYPWSKSGPFPEAYPWSGVTGLGHENDWGSLGIEERDHDDFLTASYAVDFLQKEHNKPFFLACGLFRPHLPWYVPQRFFDMYRSEDVILPEVKDDDLNDIPDSGQKLAADRRKDLKLIRQSQKWREAVEAYLASISFADDQIGRVLQALEASDARNSTIVVLWSDHGWHLGEKDHWHKSTLWEEATRVPFIIKAPGFSSGECSKPVNLIDLLPTFVELCYFEPVPNLDGQSLVPLLQNPQAQWDRPSVIEYRKGNGAVRSERYRLIRYADGSEELYDHNVDPQEWTNLAGSPEVATIQSELAEWLPTKWADSAPTKSAYNFDPDNYTWTVKSTGDVIDGKTP
ncbi:Choline-sulfatase [Thalassoglobus neptunius]|uniref:Choline-sulfatase n=1 Tax=Thalassoglobus neptunius TaxID=1938619 RepID=A0A5C5WMA3_9PLAN|nr:sulfatase [Thalassoglobus neptunius]TWT51956.1 Choline-sulfatase [Thalassoglobus neptunius]